VNQACQRIQEAGQDICLLSDSLACLGYCGDGQLNQPNVLGIEEECDDGNNVGCDGCNANCQIESGQITILQDYFELIREEFAHIYASGTPNYPDYVWTFLSNEYNIYGQRNACSLGNKETQDPYSVMTVTAEAPGSCTIQVEDVANCAKATAYVLVRETQCSNFIDDDLDGFIDLEDPDCSGYYDDLESHPVIMPECADGIDNDEDGDIDYPCDFGCESRSDNSEDGGTTQCSDSIDNDADVLIDRFDPACMSRFIDSETV